ncbi:MULTISPECIES: hypothetical protein [Bacillus]|uniref:hypothetical protein n=1 Tax=Bacillus TaxID=1386 RepID=UPI000B9B9CA7|nr:MULTISPECIES: hypothetical protein [Bacillus]MCP1160877.1 hypothetical protein [Bacillus infantis]OXT15657.1 hypothetical protein B9K06_19795 [Bacillus sp. OG2]PLR73370.1 hypothetical protein CYJ37_07430 [Bacillus sp. UMB0728]
MTKKSLKWGIGAIVLLAILLSFDKWKLYKEEKPPFPEIVSEGKEAQAVLFDYSWNGTDTSKALNKANLSDSLESMEALPVGPFSDLSVSFPEKPDLISISAWEPRLEEEIYKQVGSVFHFTNRPGTVTLVIKAEWNKGKATYLTRVKTEKIVSYQELLAPDKEVQTVIGFAVSNSSSLKFANKKPGDRFASGYISGELDYLQKAYPELELNELPSYFVFKQEKIVYRTTDMQELKSYISKH